jgi:fructose-bisphosphate aldolase class I
MNAHTMESTVAALLAPGKGILAADESFPTIEKRFKALNISSTEQNRDGIAKCCSRLQG